MGRILQVATKKDFEAAAALSIEVESKEIAVFKISDNYYAIDNTCTHRGGPLADGDISGSVVTCPWHGATFDVTSGKVLGSPASRDVQSYTVIVDGDKISLEIS